MSGSSNSRSANRLIKTSFTVTSELSRRELSRPPIPPLPLPRRPSFRLQHLITNPICHQKKKQPARARATTLPSVKCSWALPFVLVGVETSFFPIGFVVTGRKNLKQNFLDSQYNTINKLAQRGGGNYSCFRVLFVVYVCVGECHLLDQLLSPSLCYLTVSRLAKRE